MMNSVKKRAVMNYDLMNKEIRGRTGKTLLAKYFDKIWPCSQKFKGSFSSILENFDHHQRETHAHLEDPINFFCRFQDCT